MFNIPVRVPTQTGRESDRQTDRHRETERDRNRERQTDRHRETKTQTERAANIKMINLTLQTFFLSVKVSKHVA